MRQTTMPVLPLTYGREQLAQALGISTPSLDRLRAANKIGPKPVRLGGRKVWVRAEVDDWLEHRDAAGNLLDGAQWEARKKAKA